jgi:long-subunit fatty acid transport protein
VRRRQVTNCAFLGCGVLAAFLALPARSDDLRYADYPIGNRAMGLGGAYTALSNDPSGLYYNPAGLVGTTRSNLSVSTSLYGVESTSPHGLAGVDFANLTSLNIIPSEVGATYAIGEVKKGTRAKAVWGFDLVVPSFRSNSYQRHEVLPSGFQDDSRTLSDQTLWAGIGGAYSINEKFSVGLSLFYQHRSTLLNERTTGQAADGSFLDETTTLDAFDDALTAIIGGQYVVGTHLTFGAAFLLPSLRIRSGGRAQVTQIQWNGAKSTPPTVTTLVADTQVDSNAMRLETHSSGGLHLGAAYVLVHEVTVAADVTGFWPTSYHRLEFKESDVEHAITLPLDVQRNLVVNFALGAEWRFHENWSVAGGLYTDRTSAPDLHPDANGQLGAAGRNALSHVDLYGGSIAFGFLSDHSLTRVGFSAVTGWGQDVHFSASAATWVVQPTRETLAYVFISSTFRY